MDFSLDIFPIYTQFCDITSRMIANKWDDHGPDNESQRILDLRDALTQLWKVVESKLNPSAFSFRQNNVRDAFVLEMIRPSEIENGTDKGVLIFDIDLELEGRILIRELKSVLFCYSISVLDEVAKLMSRLDLKAEYSEFSRFYDFVFFICRENGQKSITVSRAIMAWRLVLSGRFRLINHWCDFVEKNQRYNISEDTWRQVLAFSRCVHENLEGYDPEGAWPVLIDDFVEYMYSETRRSSFCNCDEVVEITSSGLKNLPGSKRRFVGEMGQDSCASVKKRHIYLADNSECVGIAKHTSSLDCSKSPCSVEGCLSKGFAGLLSGPSCLKFEHDARVPYT